MGNAQSAGSADYFRRGARVHRSHKIAWDAAIDEAIVEAKEQMQVEFVDDVDKEAFRTATSGMIADYCSEYPGVQSLLDTINSVE